MDTDSFADQVEYRRQEVFNRIGNVRISALIWGPTPNDSTPVGLTRKELRRALEEDGHLVRFSEELYDPSSGYSLMAQQLADVEAHDITFSLPDSPGSIAEIHDFARIPSVSHRIVTFVDAEHNDGYANKTLLEIQSTATCKVQIYNPIELPGCIINKARDLVRRLQEFYYLAGRRI